MADILDDLRKVVRLNGDTYSSAEVIGMVGKAAQEIEWLREQIEDACQVLENYDLPEHAFHYRRELKRRATPPAEAGKHE